MPDQVEISTDPHRLDIDWIVRHVQASYWGGHMKPVSIAAAVSKSLCFGAYDGDTQIGFARIVTDGTFFSSLVEIIVQEDRRGHGVGSALMNAVVAHPDVAGTMCILRARPAAALWYYKNFGFSFLDKSSGVMQRDPK